MSYLECDHIISEKKAESKRIMFDLKLPNSVLTPPGPQPLKDANSQFIGSVRDRVVTAKA